MGWLGFREKLRSSQYCAMNNSDTAPTRTTPLVFVNYRSDDEPWAAMLLARELTARFLPGSVFLDCLSIRAGDDYRPALLGGVARSSVLLVVIGKRWLTASRDGKRLLDNEQDWVRREIAMAGATGVRVVPVLVGGAELPRAMDLPDDIEFLAHRQCLQISRHNGWTDLDHVVTSLGVIEPRLLGTSIPSPR